MHKTKIHAVTGKYINNKSGFTFLSQLTRGDDNLALPTFAAVCHAVAWLLLTTHLSAMQQSINISWLLGPQQQTCSSSIWQLDGTDGQKNDSCMNPAPNTM